MCMTSDKRPLWRHIYLSNEPKEKAGAGTWRGRGLNPGPHACKAHTPPPSYIPNQTDSLICWQINPVPPLKKMSQTISLGNGPALSSCVFHSPARSVLSAPRGPTRFALLLCGPASCSCPEPRLRRCWSRLFLQNPSYSQAQENILIRICDFPHYFSGAEIKNFLLCSPSSVAGAPQIRVAGGRRMGGKQFTVTCGEQEPRWVFRTWDAYGTSTKTMHLLRRD